MCVCGDDDEVAGPLSSYATAERLFYDVHLNTSTCPDFATDRSSGGKVMEHKHSKRHKKQMHCHCVTGMIKQLFLLFCGLNV